MNTNKGRLSKVKLFAGFIFKEEAILKKVIDKMEVLYSSVDYMSDIMPFEYTDYYHKEMGKPLLRVFVSFKELIAPDALADIKISTCVLEAEYSNENKRSINIDPGYMELSKLVLASTKNFYHRIYIKKDIYEEITLCWQKNRFRDFEWTFPDFRSKEYKLVFSKIREIYTEQLNNESHNNT